MLLNRLEHAGCLPTLCMSALAPMLGACPFVPSAGMCILGAFICCPHAPMPPCPHTPMLVEYPHTHYLQASASLAPSSSALSQRTSRQRSISAAYCRIWSDLEVGRPHWGEQVAITLIGSSVPPWPCHLCSTSPIHTSVCSPIHVRPALVSGAALPSSELLLLHVDSATSRMALRSCADVEGGVASTSGLKPCELKFAPCISNLVCLTCRFEIQGVGLELQARLSDSEAL